MKEFSSKLKKILGDFSVKNLQIQKENFLIMFNIPKKNLSEVLHILKDDQELQFTILTDITACDYPDRDERFELIYNLLSLKYNIRVIIKISLDFAESIDSIHKIFSAAIWYEREIWDMFGIKFNNNPDLRRILTDYGFSGHPLRKDFPVFGYNEVRYDENQKKVIYEPVNLQQEYRNFDFVSPWEGPQASSIAAKKGEK